jgi:signal transduction histidine kinase
MHDTVIQGCTTISALLEASASMDDSDQDSARELNVLARKQIETTILEARQAVWNLRHGTPLQDEIEPAIAKIAQDAGEEFGKPVLFTRVGEAFPVTAWVTHELLMTIREAVHNALLHGHPSVVRIQAQFSSEELSITTEDDGMGFNPAAELPERPGHFGLQGMYERMNRIGAQLIIESSPSRGTIVKIIAAAALCREDRALERV